MAIGVVGLVAFIIVESRMGDTALIPLRIFKNRAIVIALSGGFVIGAGMFGGMITLPQYLQIVHGSTPTMSGVQLLPMVLGMMIASVLSGQLISRTGNVRIFPIVGVGLMTVALAFLSRIGADTPWWQLITLMAIFGMGLGNTMQPLTLAVQASVAPREIGMATSSATFFRQMGGTLGVAVFLSLLFNTLGDNVKNAFLDASKTPEFLAAMRDPNVLANPVNAQFVKALTSGDTSALASVSSDSSIIGKLDPVLSHPFKVGFSPVDGHGLPRRCDRLRRRASSCCCSCRRSSSPASRPRHSSRPTPASTRCGRTWPTWQPSRPVDTSSRSWTTARTRTPATLYEGRWQGFTDRRRLRTFDRLRERHGPFPEPVGVPGGLVRSPWTDGLRFNHERSASEAWRVQHPG